MVTVELGRWSLQLCNEWVCEVLRCGQGFMVLPKEDGKGKSEGRCRHNQHPHQWLLQGALNSIWLWICFRERGERVCTECGLLQYSGQRVLE